MTLSTRLSKSRKRNRWFPLFVQNHGLHKKGVEFIDLLCKAPTGGEVAEGASGSAPERKGGTHDRIRWEDSSSHRRRQRNGPRAGPPAGGGSLQRRDVRRLADGLGGNAKALRGRGIAARAARRRTSLMSPTGRRSSGFATRLPTATRPARSICCS